MVKLVNKVWNGLKTAGNHIWHNKGTYTLLALFGYSVAKGPQLLAKDNTGSVGVYGGMTFNSDKKLNDEHKLLFPKSSDLASSSLGGGIEADFNLNSWLKAGAGFNYNAPKKVDSVGVNGNYLER